MTNKHPSKFLVVTWGSFERHCIVLSKKLRKVKINKIIAISRGGLVPARILSDFLSIPISHISISSYKNLRAEQEPLIKDVPKGTFKNKNLLIVDDVSDSGKTLKRAIKYFSEKNTKKIYTATIFVKPRTSEIPDFWIKKTNDWIIFPYELKETAKAFLKIFKNENKARKQLLMLGFKESKINYMLKNEV